MVALKEAAFGRTRAGSDQTVQRDFHDAYLLIDTVMDDVLCEWQAAGHEIRERARQAILKLGEGGDATAAAAREMVQLGQAVSQRQAETRVRRVAGRRSGRWKRGSRLRWISVGRLSWLRCALG